MIVKSCAFFFSFALVSAIFYKYRAKKKPENRVVRKEIHEAIMFSSDCPIVYKSKFSRYNVTESMSKLLHYIKSTKYTIDICMYLLTNWDVAQILTKLHHRGIKIRIIVDADMVYAQKSFGRKLEKIGVSVRWMKSTNLMHHKFCIIDAVDNGDETTTPLVIMGSLNWTNQAFYGNWEDVIVTSQPILVQQYNDEFRRLWEAFRPIV